MSTVPSGEFRLPDVGEGLTEAEIVSWHVSVGDEIEVNAPLVDIETAKSIVELPSPFAGRVEELLVSEGDTVAVGTPIVRIGSGDAAAEPSGDRASVVDAAADRVAGERSEPPTQTPERLEVLVGYGPSTGRRRTRNRAAAATENPSRSSVRVLAKPPVRKLAKDLGIDLTKVPARGDVVTRA
ncbi:MAG: biotin/lipoyl-containing protein, partial [Aeromicrobium sp.]